MPTLKRKSPCATLTLDDGSTVDVERIGKGHFSTAWRNSHNVYLQTHESDYGKEIVAVLSRMNRNPHIPDCRELGWQEGNAPFRWYRMPLYQPLTAKHKEAWAQFKTLREIVETVQRKRMSEYFRVKWEVCQYNQAIVDAVQDAACLPDTLKEAVEELANQAMSYGEYSLEIAKRNCAVDESGTLILLDPLFDQAKIDAEWKRKQKAGF